MSKQTSTIEKQPIMNADWLRTTRVYRKKRHYSDAELIYLIIGKKDKKFTRKSFDNVFNLKAVENTEKLSVERIDRVLRYPEHPLPSDVEGRDIWEQADSLVRSELPDELREPLVYLIGRIMIDNAPKLLGNWDMRKKTDRHAKSSTQVKEPDPISAALVTLNTFMEISGQQMWIDTFNDEDIWSDYAAWPLTMWDNVSTRYDGAIVSEWEKFLLKLRCKINLLHSSSLVELCGNLSKRKQRINLSQRYMRDTLGRVDRVSTNLPFLLVERVLPSIARMGLQYRMVLSPVKMKVIWSPGTVDRFKLNDIEVKDVDYFSSYRFATLHLESNESDGPPHKQIPIDTIQVVVEKETLSLRFDMFNEDTGNWNLRAMTHEDKKSRWLFKESPKPKKERIIPTQREIDTLSIFWSHRGNPQSNNRLMQGMGVPRSVQESSLKQLFKRKLLSVMYHPIEDYIGIPDGVFVVAYNLSTQELDRYREWLLRNTPCVRLLESQSVGNLIGIVRLPLFGTGVWIGRLLHELADFTDRTIVQPIDRHFSYKMTVLNRVYNPEIPSWIDPWNL
ncbi:MAG: hypothetical protein RTU30_06680 [Candidatus Thorarchaeota archaeon]